jgi:orotidine-5'-phosphate decarboxylase
MEQKPQDRIIVALDVPTAQEALDLVEELCGLISFYKVGLELLMSGSMETLLSKLVKENRVFVDLKLPNDIPETVRRVVDLAGRIGATFITLSNSATTATILAAKAGRGDRENPQLLFVSFLSSLDRNDFSDLTGEAPEHFDGYLERRTDIAKAAGADGFIVSGQEAPGRTDCQPWDSRGRIGDGRSQASVHAG